MKKAMLLAGLFVMGIEMKAFSVQDQLDRFEEKKPSAYFETMGGAYIGDQTAPSYGVRIGNVKETFDGSFGYWSAQGDTILHTLNGEICKMFPISSRTALNAGLGVGYTMISPPGAEKADSDVSWGIVAGLSHDLSDTISLGLNVRGFFFNTDTHSTSYRSHVEQLSSGQNVEVLDVHFHTNSVNYNALLLAFTVKWK